jgi:predicted nucleic acid-binding protein
MKNSSTCVLLDTDFLVSLFIPEQSTHHAARSMHENIRGSKLCILDIVLCELATVLSRKFSQKDAKKILARLREHSICMLSFGGIDTKKTWQEWFEKDKNGTSYFDCANLIMAKKIGCKVASFDRFYPKELRVS